ncbi:ornithine cyclodeaminase family protein [Agrobacterium tumefaciens]|uniref:ornithine cyclodeaminase family protein n=1 Tax=Agrobacterium tumefaciens TaxID=358 RepID=UPI0021D35E7E|nr:ornithine cyclodeaminase family protein [Agrobacterium tumefaciens]UXS47602.1 ornithine cyclodeaminase family protein [Agrobacterium tumefaciens]
MARILNDGDLLNGSFINIAIEAVENILRDRAHGQTISPPRHHVSFPGRGDLIFTVGGTLGEKPLAGFRVYETFVGTKHAQIVAVWSADNGRLKGLIVGERLGAIRTGAIGGVAIRHLSSPDASVVGVLGSGLQARSQLEAAVAVRKITSARVYSRDETQRNLFAREMEADLGIEIRPADSVYEAVSDADIVICATSSNQPVVHASDLKRGVHLNTVGPKTLDGYELALDIADMASTIATDSSEQTRAYTSPFFLIGSGNENRMVELSDIVAGKAPGRTSADQMTLFCSAGLAGTEVAVASAIFDNL